MTHQINTALKALYTYLNNHQTDHRWLSIKIKPVATTILSQVDGSGIIHKIWMTTFPFQKEYNNQLANSMHILIHWDQSDIPAIDVPLSHFFCQAFELKAFCNRFFSSTNDQFVLQSHMPMPFHQGASISIKNESDQEIELFYAIEIEKQEIKESAMSLHAYYRRFDHIHSDQAIHDIIQIKGGGRYLGCHMSVHQYESLANWPWYTRPIQFDIDSGEESFTVNTLDDYFGAAWWDREGAHPIYIYTDYGRSHVRLHRDNTLDCSMYIYHAESPIWYHQSLRISLKPNWDYANQTIGPADWDMTFFVYQTHG